MVRHRGTGEMIRTGSVYVLHSPRLGDGVFKIGMSTGDVMRRATDVGRQFSIPGGLAVLFAQPTNDAYQLETRVHRDLQRYRLRPEHALCAEFGLERSREFFQGLTLRKIEKVIARALEGLEVEDDWCQQLRTTPARLAELKGPAGCLDPGDPRILYWINKLTANGSKTVAVFTLEQLAKGVKDTAGKTSYLTWRFGGKGRAWFDPTYPRAASTLIHRRFNGDLETWKTLLSDDVAMHEYKEQTELRLMLWTEDHMDALRKVVEEIMPKTQFLT